MYYPHTQNQNSSSAVGGKHHDGGPPGPSGLRGWGQHTFTPSMPLPSPGGYPNGGGAGGAFGGPGGLHHVGGHPHHPSFGGGGGGPMHMGSQNPGGGMGMGHGQQGAFGMGGMFGGGSPPRNGADQMPMTPLWQQQVAKADACRQNSSAHHRARTAAVSSRSANKAAITISDPNRPASSASNVNGAHKKNLSVISSTDRSSTPDFGGNDGGGKAPAISHADPANPAAAPVPTKEDVPWEQWSGLDLGGIRITTLAPAMFSFTHITSLYINHNVLTSIPPAIANLRQLTLLDATGNELSSIPPEIGVLSKLKELLLFDNHITTLPAEIGTLYKLEMLGIEGNPLEERYRRILAEDGTTALIHHLRDLCPAPPIPPPREWIEIEQAPTDPDMGRQESFTTLTYNILCDSFAPQASYTYTPSWALDWDYRKHTILTEITNAMPDIVCLQEIDVGQYREYFYPSLQEKGYDGCHYARTRARTMVGKEADAVDGCATFWKTDKFSLVETQVIEFNRLALQKEHMRTDDMFNRVASRDNIAVVASLEFIASGARLLAVNSHIFWDHQFRDVKIVQIGMLMEELEQIAERFSKLPPKPSTDPDFNGGRGPPKYNPALRGTDIPLVLCVDLNSHVDSAVYEFLSNGEIAPDHADFMTHTYGEYTKRGLKHRLGLRSSCASIGEMKMTNFTPTFVATIDYIFYSHSALTVKSVLGDVDKAYLDKQVGFPTAHFPSDHIPVLAHFSVKGKADSGLGQRR